MYEAFYGLSKRPFAVVPDASFLYLGHHHRHALTMMEYALLHGVGFAVLTGGIGSGKTTLVRAIVKSVDTRLSVSLLTNTHPAAGPLLPWLYRAVGLSARAGSHSELYQGLVNRLTEVYRSGRRSVLIIDEAQNLGVSLLEELRVLSNINTDGQTLLQTLLVGQPELRTELQGAGLRQFAQRIAIDYHLGNLNREETHAYVHHRLTIAGGTPELIGTAAVDAVHSAAGGVPRLINILCDMALVYGFAEQRRAIDVDLMTEVIEERAAGGLLPLAAKGSAQPQAPLSVG